MNGGSMAMTNVAAKRGCLWQVWRVRSDKYVLAENGEMGREDSDIYKGGARKTKRRFDPR